MCVNFRAGTATPSCAGRGAREVADIVEREWAARDMPLGFERVHCLGKCHLGPTMRLVPAGPFIIGAKDEKDVTRILDLLEDGRGDQAAAEFPLPETDIDA